MDASPCSVATLSVASPGAFKRTIRPVGTTEDPGGAGPPCASLAVASAFFAWAFLPWPLFLAWGPFMRYRLVVSHAPGPLTPAPARNRQGSMATTSPLSTTTRPFHDFGWVSPTPS